MTTGIDQTPNTDLEAARLLLARLGIAPEQLITAPPPPTDIPTFDEYIDRAMRAASPGSIRVYESYWNRVRLAWGKRRLSQVTALDIRELSERMKDDIVVRRNARGGRTATEHLIGALRCLYQFAIDDGLIREADDPSRRVSKPARLPSNRQALLPWQVAKIRNVAEETGNDPDLDTLIIDFHLQTAGRRGGALALRMNDLDLAQCLVRLHEKGGTMRWQPVTPSLMRRLVALATSRDAKEPTDAVLRYQNGKPMTYRRYDSLWNRIGKRIPWVKSHDVATHWLRHTTLTWVDRNCGYGVAQAYAGHYSSRGDKSGTTAAYVKGTLYEVALALSKYTGEQHPLAASAGQPSDSMWSITGD